MRLHAFVTGHIDRLEQYGKNLVEYGLILDLVPALGALYLSRRMPEIRLSSLQSHSDA